MMLLGISPSSVVAYKSRCFTDENTACTVDTLILEVVVKCVRVLGLCRSTMELLLMLISREGEIKR